MGMGQLQKGVFLLCVLLLNCGDSGRLGLHPSRFLSDRLWGFVCSDRKKNLGKVVGGAFSCCGGVKELIVLVFFNFSSRIEFFLHFFFFFL